MQAQHTQHVRNAAWSVAEGIGYPVLLLLATPVLLKTLGAEGFGLWTLLITITSIGSVVGIGIGPAVIKLVAQSSVDAATRVEDVARGAMAVACLAGGALAVAVALITWHGSHTWLGKLGPPALVLTTGLFSAAVLWVEQFDVVISATLKGLENFSLAARLEIGLKLSQISLVIAAAWTTQSLVVAFAVLLSMATIRLSTKAFFLKRHCPGIRLSPKLALIPPVLQISKWGWVQGFGSVFFLSADRLIVGAALGSVSLGYYSIAVQLVSQLHTFIANAFSIIVPRVSKMGARKDTEQTLRRTSRNLMALNVAMAVGGAALLWAVGPWLLRIWVGPEVASHVAEAFTVLVLAYGVLSLSIVPFHVLTGLGAMRFIAIVLSIGGCVTLLLTFVLVPMLGIEGAAMARAGYALIALVLLVPVFTARRVRLSPELHVESKRLDLF